ncbi:MAG: hypothetical protein JXA96_13840 [Sedimentisphaerales bacterium]|nr:hypothetical protein [Sedimentisphaerales bacterium]
MIEKSLRLWLRPVVNRQKRLYIMKKLSLYWFLTALFGVALLAANKLFGWTLPGGFGVLIILALLAVIIVFIKSSSIEPDYLKLARSIETQNPDLQATLLTAIEQKPKDFGGQLDYLQERVIGEALAHARQHNWVESIPQSRFIVAGLANAAALFLFLFILSNFSVPKLSNSSNNPVAAVKPKGYEITVTPGDTTVELGTSVVILARFDGKLPSDAKLFIGSNKEDLQEEPFTKNLEDPIFGAIIPQINSDTVYHIEYDNNLTQDFTIGTFQHPSLERADANIVYPAYTKLPNKEIKDTRRFNVVENSTVTLSFKLNKPVDTAQLISKDGSVLNLSVDTENPTMLTTLIQPQENLRYELKLVDSDGRANKAPPRFVIDVHKNMPPELKLKFPKGDVEASPLEELALEGEVSDDYGVTSRGFAYIMAGSQSKDVTVGNEPVPANKKEPVQYVLAMEDLKVQPDQLLSYYMWAEDIGPDGNPRKTVSDLYFAEVRDFEQIFRENQSFMDQNQQQQQQEQQQQEGQQDDQQRREQLVQLQKQIISATWNIKRQVDSSNNGVENKKEDITLIMESQTEALEIAREGGDQSTGTQDGGARGGGQGGQGGRGGRGGRGGTMQPSGLMSQVNPPATNPENASSNEPMDKAIEYMENALKHLEETLANSTSDELLEALSSEQAAYQELLKLREEESQVARDRSNQQSNQNQSQRQQQQLQQLEMRQREDRYEMQSEAQQQQQQQEQQREDLQVLNRLRDLARRQNDMTERLREAESALREAENEQERQEIQRELERLREEQVQNMRDADELQQRMENQQNNQQMQESAEQLSQTRERMQQSAEQMQQGQVSEAAANSTRAERELEQMRDEFQRSTSGQFSQQMQDMRQQARELDERQQQISQEMTQQQSGSQQTSLDEAGTNQDLAERVQEQRDLLEQLLDQMREISEESEESEPLLSSRLYDTYRQASTENLEEALETTEELLRRNFVPQAQGSEEQARESIQNLREGIEEAAQGLLGDEEDALRLAREQIDEALNQLGSNDPNQNMQAQNDQRGQRGQRSGDPNQMGNMQAQEGQRGGDPNQMGNMQAQEGQRGQRGGDPNQMGNMQAQEGQRGQRGGDPNQIGNMQAQEGQRGQRGQQGSNPNQTAQGGGQFDITQLENMLRNNQNGQGGAFQPTGEWNINDPNNPLTGQNFREWADRLREVEEMLSEQELREQVAEVREQAREIREDYTRNSEEPQWDVVEMNVVKPLTEVRKRITEELAKIESKEAIVPIDRDPVPERYSELVRAYYENLGGTN